MPLGFDAGQGDASRGHQRIYRGSKILFRQSPSSSGLGRRPLTPTTRVRTPLGTPGFLKIARPPQRIRAIFLSLGKVKSVGRSVRKTISLHRLGKTVHRPPNGFRRYIRTVCRFSPLKRERRACRSPSSGNISTNSCRDGPVRRGGDERAQRVTGRSRGFRSRDAFDALLQWSATLKTRGLSVLEGPLLQENLP